MKTVWFEDNKVKMINQKLLPLEEKVETYDDYRQVAAAIKDLTVRGAPAIGIAAAYAVVLAALENNEKSFMQKAASEIKGTRPTAVNLFYAVNKMENLISEEASPDAYIEVAREIEVEDDKACKSMGELGASLINDGDCILTHCNAGGLATGGYGTAVGVIKSAFAQGKNIHVFVDETRPLLQGARLTAWELSKEGISYTLITDNMSAHFMAEGKIDKIFVGADRIAANGDTANKIGTYGVAVCANYHNIPFYVAAPVSTLDLSLKSGKDIPIEYRSKEEVTHFSTCQSAPSDAQVLNPAFDVTPAKLITAIITEVAIIKPPFEENLINLKGH